MNAVAVLSDNTREFLNGPKMYIDGQFVMAEAGETIEVLNPATAAHLTVVPAGAKADIDRAVAAARASFEARTWRGKKYTVRAEILWRWAEMMMANAQQMAEIECLDNGMPLTAARHSIEAGCNTIRYYAGMISKNYGQTSEISGEDGEYHTYSINEPVGVAGLMTPWNGPFMTACTKSASALAAGCSVVLKPSEFSPLTALMMARFAQAVGIPAGVFNVVTGFGGAAGAALASHPDVNKISFTGSTEVGKLLVHNAADDMRRLSLELGGKSPVFVFEDADIEAALPAVAMGIFRNTGQVCFAGSRVYVQESIYDTMLERLAQFAKALRLGDGMAPDTQLGPLISGRQRDRVQGYVRSGVEEGAEIVFGGNALDRPGYFMQPTIFTRTQPQMKVVREEIFGPVLVVEKFKSFDEVASLANDTPFGLGAGFYTTNVSTAHRAVKIVNAGNVWVNCYGFTDKTMPFGGYKQSGWGREGGYEGMEAFLEKKSVYMKI